MWAASDLIAHYIHDERLRDVLAYMNPMYGGVEGHTPAYIHALINVLYISGPSRFVGGSQQMADALARVICEGGGSIIRDEKVTVVNVDEQRLANLQGRLLHLCHSSFPIGGHRRAWGSSQSLSHACEVYP